MAIATLKCFSAALTLLIASIAHAIEPVEQYPGAAPGGTRFLNQDALLVGVEDPDWFKHNIPFLEVPDTEIQQVYYYRWQTYKEHLVYTSSIYGWLSSEFLEPASYGAPYGGISAAAGHYIYEGRWLRNQQYVKDIVHYWLNGPGQFPKPMDDFVNKDTSDWAHEYSFWAGSAVWQFFLATGDKEFAINALPHLVKYYRSYDTHFNPTLGLYWQVPVWDATELTPASYESSDPYHGGAGYRPTINAYQYGDARAIAQIARLINDTVLADEYDGRAAALQTAMNELLWDKTNKFYYHMHRDDNPNQKLLTTRELQGFVPWMFNMPTVIQTPAMEQLLDPEGFQAAYGPTTAERRSKWFNYEAYDGCCHWDGPSWPYETCQMLTGLANLLIDYPAQSTITSTDYVNLLHTYAATQFRNGKPYVAEAHDADADNWLYDGLNHSEDYNHSTFVDNIISGLIGVRGQSDDTVQVHPLAPASWDYFLLENVPYHGHSLTVLWDRTGNRYGQGSGFKIYIDGKIVSAGALPGNTVVNVGKAITQRNENGVVNHATNTQKFSYGSQPFASFTSYYDNVWNGIDGIVFRNGLPQNSRWTSYSSTNAQDHFGVNFQRPVTISEVRLTFYDDNGGVRLPTSFELQYWNGHDWLVVPDQTISSVVANAATTITFPKLTTSQLRVLAPNRGNSVGWGLSELQAFGKPVFQFVNVLSSKLMAVENESKEDGAQVQQYHDNGTPDHLWELIDAGGGWFKIRNINSALVLSVRDKSLDDSALIEQAIDVDGDHQRWTFIDNGDGQFKIRNERSALLLGVSNMSIDDEANVVQFHDNGTADHLWKLYSANDPR